MVPVVFFYNGGKYSRDTNCLTKTHLPLCAQEKIWRFSFSLQKDHVSGSSLSHLSPLADTSWKDGEDQKDGKVHPLPTRASQLNHL